MKYQTHENECRSEIFLLSLLAKLDIALPSPNKRDTAAIHSADPTSVRTRGSNTLGTKHTSGYRSDIDGLRAISIIFVILYHLMLHFIPGGFLGVDIFFVISGFLITSHIIDGINQNNFSFKTFYLKRAKRILPALITVLIATSIAAYFLFMPYDLKQFAGTLFATIGFYSNLYFWRVIGVRYFSPNVSVMPLLHTWSLAIEEQFYIFWPLFLYLSYKFISRTKVFLLTAFTALGSFLLFILCKKHPGLAFYHPRTMPHDVFAFFLPFTRAYELLIGALLAINYEKIKLPQNKILCHLLSLIGLVMILFAGLVLQKNDFPGAWILVPCLGAFLVILIGKNSDFLGNKILSNPVFVFIGLISYSLYLWHWLIIAFVNYFEIPLSFLTDASIIFASILLATLTWKFIEQPFRFKLKYKFTNGCCWIQASWKTVS